MQSEHPHPSSDRQQPTLETRQPPEAIGLWERGRSVVYDRFLGPLVFSKHPPRFDATGVCVGLVVGLATPIGAHTVAVALLRLVLKFNFVVGLAFTWVCNPFNVFFLYYGYYVLGSVVLGEPISMEFEGFRNLLHPVADKAYFWETVSAFVQLGRELLVRWCVAAVILGTIFGVLGYVITYHIQKKRCVKAAKKMRLGYDAYIQELERKTAGIGK
jgi:uncharacterized protein (DUF2062 family)